MQQGKGRSRSRLATPPQAASRGPAPSSAALPRAHWTLLDVKKTAPAPGASPLFSPTLPTDCGRQAMSCTVMPLGHLRPWDCRRGTQVAGSSGQLCAATGCVSGRGLPVQAEKAAPCRAIIATARLHLLHHSSSQLACRKLGWHANSPTDKHSKASKPHTWNLAKRT